MQKMTLLLFFVRLLNNYVGGSITNLRRQVISPENGTVHARTEQLDKGRRSAAGRRRSGVQQKIFFFMVRVNKTVEQMLHILLIEMIWSHSFYRHQSERRNLRHHLTHGALGALSRNM